MLFLCSFTLLTAANFGALQQVYDKVQNGKYVELLIA